MHIALDNFQFNIITKVLDDKLNDITCKIVLVLQKGLIKGRHIQYSILISLEAINRVDKRSCGGNLSLKIDIKKTFDSLYCCFLINVLK